MTYPLLKAVHLIFAVSWFAGLFYIFRLFVYHVHHWDDVGSRAIFEVMEMKLLKYIMLPAATGTASLGLLMFRENPALFQIKWMWLKLVFVLMLLGYHAFAWRVHREMRRGNRVLSERACRAINEVPTLALIAISILVFLKPAF